MQARSGISDGCGCLGRYQCSQSQKNRNQVDYKALDIDRLCLKCARADHRSHECRTDRNSLKCRPCHKLGHLSKVCITTLLQKSKTNTLSTQHCPVEEESLSDTEYGIGRIQNSEDSTNLGSDRDKYFVTVKLNSKPQTFEVDSGARLSLISESAFRKHSLDTPLEPTTVSFRSYSDHIIKPMGKVALTVTYKNRTIDAELYVVPAGHNASLGRVWIRGIGISLNEIDREQVGCVPNVEVKLQLREGVKPAFIRERDVPFSLRERVEKELTLLEAQGIISPVASSDWGSPLVVIAKPDGGVRLCVDYKCGVNSKLVAANHPIRRIDEVLHSLRGSKFFCKLDLHKAYLHLKVDEEGSKIQTISTHKGTYRMNRLSFGIKTAPSEFNRILSQILHGLPNVEVYFDDIICHGANLNKYTRNSMACLECLKENDLHLNKSKCSFFKEKIDYLDHVVSFNKIEKSPDKIQAVSEIPRPRNTEDLKPSTEAAFVDLKSELSCERVLTPFDPSKPVILTTDASSMGISAILSHSIDGVEQLVAGLDDTIRCKKGKDNENVHCLPRAPVTLPNNAPAIAVDAEVNALYAETLLQISSSAITADTIAEETARDHELRTLIKDLKNNPKDSPFTIVNDMLFRLDRAVIPKALQPQILEELYATHLGITKMKQLARRYVWERIDKDIERLVKSCEPCARVRHNPQKAEVHPWYLPEENWGRVYIGYAGPFQKPLLLNVCGCKIQVGRSAHFPRHSDL
nr:uncharacterized protein K02A2.6-like [Halyomorpha halys]